MLVLGIVPGPTQCFISGSFKKIFANSKKFAKKLHLKIAKTTLFLFNDFLQLMVIGPVLQKEVAAGQFIFCKHIIQSQQLRPSLSCSSIQKNKAPSFTSYYSIDV